jgi:hypothetical protein
LLAAIVAAAVWSGAQGQASAQSQSTSPPAASPATPPAAEPQKPAEGNPPKAGEGSGQKPADDAAVRHRLVSILGREITNREGDGGRVIDVLVDLDGRSGAVVVEFGGFMGIGSRRVALEWGTLRFVRDGNRTTLTADITREQIRDAAEYKPNEPASVLTTR